MILSSSVTFKTLREDVTHVAAVYEQKTRSKFSTQSLGRWKGTSKM
jgi:hypothetical protein